MDRICHISAQGFLSLKNKEKNMLFDIFTLILQTLPSADNLKADFFVSYILMSVLTFELDFNQLENERNQVLGQHLKSP